MIPAVPPPLNRTSPYLYWPRGFLIMEAVGKKTAEEGWSILDAQAWAERKRRRTLIHYLEYGVSDERNDH